LANRCTCARLAADPARPRVAFRSALILASCFATTLAVGCGDDSSGSGESSVESKDGGSDSGEATEAGKTPEKDAGAEPPKPDPAKQHIYAFVREVGDEEVSNFVTLTKSIDLKSDSPELATSKAREFKGAVFAVSGNLIEVDGSTIRQWKVTDDLKFVEGASVNFSDYPLPEGGNYFFQFISDDHHLFLPFDVSSRIVWDPIDMKIVKVVEDSKVPLELDGLMALPGGNRTEIRYDGTIKMPYFYLDEDYIEFADKTTLGLYDRQTFAEVGTIDLPCPGLAIATQDEDKNTYYSTWDFSPLQALYGKGPKPCVARLKPDDKLDEAFTTDLTDLTEGRFSANFWYVRDGWGLTDVLHNETLDLDFTASTIPPEAVDEVWKKEHWKIWFVDLKNKTAHPLDQLGADINRAFWELMKVGNRTFLRLETEAETVKFYELGEAGSATLFDEIKEGGATWQMVR
jgi:hypothetical protein